MQRLYQAAPGDGFGQFLDRDAGLDPADVVGPFLAQETPTVVRINRQGDQARVMFVKQANDFVPELIAAEWDFLPEETIGLEFDDGRWVHYSGFCHHDGIVLLSRSGAA